MSPPAAPRVRLRVSSKFSFKQSNFLSVTHGEPIRAHGQSKLMVVMQLFMTLCAAGCHDRVSKRPTQTQRSIGQQKACTLTPDASTHAD